MQGEKIKYSVLLYLACEHMVFGLKNSKERYGPNKPINNDAQELDNIWKNHACKLDSFDRRPLRLS